MGRHNMYILKTESENITFIYVVDEPNKMNLKDIVEICLALRYPFLIKLENILILYKADHYLIKTNDKLLSLIRMHDILYAEPKEIKRYLTYTPNEIKFHETYPTETDLIVLPIIPYNNTSLKILKEVIKQQKEKQE